MARRHGNRPRWQQRTDNPEVEELLGEPEGQSQEAQPAQPEADYGTEQEEYVEEPSQGEDTYAQDSYAEAEAVPEDDNQGDGQQKPESRAQKRIRELIERNKQLEQRFDQFSGLKQELEEWKRAQQQQQKPEEPKEPEITLPQPPDYVDQEVKDYFNGLQNYITQREQQYQRQIEELQGGYSQQQQQAQQQQQLQMALNKARSMEEGFSSRTPDYYDALNHMRDVQMQILTEDYKLPRDQAQAQIQQDELQRLQSALNMGQDVAEITYNMARRFGYQPKQQKKRQAAPDKSRASLNMGGSPRNSSLQDFGEKEGDEFDAALRELFK